MLDLPPSWQEIAEEILKQRPRRILVLGGVDVGKSTLCFYLLEQLVRAGLKVALVDADVGQKDVGPPTTVGLRHFFGSLPEKRPLPAEKLYFVGSTTPVGHLLPLVVGTKKLCDLSQGEITLINTTGLIRGPGLALKVFKIESLEPDLILALERAQELEEILSGFRHRAIRRLEVSPQAIPKGIAERRRRREEAYRWHFRGAGAITLPLKDLIWQRRPKNLKKNLLCAVSDGNEVKALAVLEEYDPARGSLTLFTPADPYCIRVIICGSVLVSRLGQELGKTKIRKGARPSGRLRSPPGKGPFPERKKRPRSLATKKIPARQKSQPAPRDRNAPQKEE